MYTTARAFLEALRDAGVSRIFANLGSDHPALIESLAEAKDKGAALPQLITCPNEMVALSAAQGYAQATGEAQAVFVHVECGTLSLGGAVHNAAKGRVPVLIFAGMSPITQQGEMRGSRNEFIHWLQDVFDQPGIVRQYVRYTNEIRTGVNVRQIVFRALQFAKSDPQGPVYLTAAREVLEQDVEAQVENPADWPPLMPSPAPADWIGGVKAALARADRPLIVTSYAGRNPQAVKELAMLCSRAGIGVLDSVPNNVNFPADHQMYQGVQGNEPRQNAALAEADLIIVIDSDVPWIPNVNRPRDGVPVFHLDPDPLKEQMPLWHIPARAIARADAATALRQLNSAGVSESPSRRAHFAERHNRWLKSLGPKEVPGTPEWVTARVRERIDDDTVILNEGITNYKAVTEHIGPRPPARMFTSGGGSLGWNGGAAIGFKLAWPDKTIVTLTGDGSYLFSLPSTVHWMARRYQAPFLQIVFNNGGWKAPVLSATAVHPGGYAARGLAPGVSFDESPDYAGIASAAGGAFGRRVERPEELDGALDEALDAVRLGGRAAVLDVIVPHL